MGLKDKIVSDIKEAMKSQDRERVATLRFLHSAIKNQEIEVRPKELTDEDVITVLKKLVKQRKDSIEQFDRAGRQDLVDKEKTELAVVEVYLPEAMPREQVEVIVEEVIASLNVTSMKQMGIVIKEIINRTAGAADNKTISEIVKTKLQSLS